MQFAIDLILVMDGLSLKKRKELVLNFYQARRDRGVAYTVNHFNKPGIARSSLHTIIKTFQERNTAERKVGRGQIPVKLTRQKRRWLVKAETDKKEVSQAKLTLKFGVDKSYV